MPKKRDGGYLSPPPPAEGQPPKPPMFVRPPDEWNRIRLIVEDHQHAGRQIGGGCACGFTGMWKSEYLDHLANVLCGRQS